LYISIFINLRSVYLFLAIKTISVLELFTYFVYLDICGLGEYLPLGGTVVADCKACEPGYYKDASVYLCKKCPNGFTSPSGSDSVNDCYGMNVILLHFLILLHALNYYRI
jgi:hypothetical protein